MKKPQFKAISLCVGLNVMTLTACVTVKPTNAYNPDELPKLTTCNNPLILRHETKAQITQIDKAARLQDVGLRIYDESEKDRRFGQGHISYLDTFMPQESCVNPLIDTHIVTNTEEINSSHTVHYIHAPIYVAFPHKSVPF